MYKFGRNKLSFRKERWTSPMITGICTIENKDLIILVFVSFLGHSMMLYQHSDSLHFFNN
jgi:hypothetical protein